MLKRKRRPPLTRIVSEEILHRHVAAFLDVVIKPPWFWTTIGHGGGGVVRGAKLKAMGVKRGWPDILIIGPGPNVLGIELKTEHGRMSPEQREMELAFVGCQSWYVLCRSVAEVQRVIDFVMRPKTCRHRYPVNEGPWICSLCGHEAEILP
jgi:hypothetical protein